MDEFYCKAYFNLEYLKFFYNNKPKEIMDFYKKIKMRINDKSFKDIDNIEGYMELMRKFRIIDKFKNKVFNKVFDKDFENFIAYINPRLALDTFYFNYTIVDQFTDSNISISEDSIRQFLISNISKISFISTLSTHKFYRNTEYFKKEAPESGYFWYGIETREFIIKHFDELFLNDEGYALGIFIFLDGIVRKYGLSDKLGIFKDIYLKGKEIMEKEFSEDELKEIVKCYIKKKEEEMGGV